MGILEKGWELERIHNLRRLKEIVGEYGIDLGTTDEDIIFMDSICRYPGEEGLLPLGDPKEDDAVRSVSIAGKIVGRINEY